MTAWTVSAAARSGAPGYDSGGRPRRPASKEADRLGLYWTAKGWRTSAIDEPSLNGDPTKVRANIEFFRSRMESYVGSRQQEWANCLKDLPNPAADVTTTTIPEDFSGRYTVEAQGGDCPNPPTSIGVTQTDRNVSFSIALTGGTLAAAGALSTDNAFDVSYSGPLDILGTHYTATFRLRGRFDKFNEQKLIRNGLYEVTIATTCSVGFTGRHQ